MSTNAEPDFSTKTSVDQNNLAGTSDLPTIQDPNKIREDLASDPALDDLKKMKKTLEEELESSENAITDAAEKGTAVTPDADMKTMATTSNEADRLRSMMASQSMQGANSRLGLPLVEETVRAIMRLLKSLVNFILRRESTPEFGSGAPGLIAAAKGTVNKVEAADTAVNDAIRGAKKVRDLEHEDENELDSPSPTPPTGSGPRPK